MYMYVYIIYVSHTHTHIHTHIHIYTHIYTYTYIYIHTYITVLTAYSGVQAPDLSELKKVHRLLPLTRCGAVGFVTALTQHLGQRLSGP
jgi:hypothetical protein